MLTRIMDRANNAFGTTKSNYAKRAKRRSIGILNAATTEQRLPLYKEREAVGGVGVEGNGAYTLDFDPSDRDVTREERIAVAATRGFAPPREIRGDRRIFCTTSNWSFVFW